MGGVANSQDIELSGGLLRNKFFDDERNNPGYWSVYDSGLGYSILLGVNHLQKNRFSWRLTIGIQKYSGGVEAGDGAMGGGYKILAEGEKTIASIGFYPLYFCFWEKLEISLGLEVATLLKENFSGTRSFWAINQPREEVDLNDEYERYNARVLLGLQGRLGYSVKLSELLYLQPQYSFILGLSPEFSAFPVYTRSLRHVLSLGVIIRLNQQSNIRA